MATFSSTKERFRGLVVTSNARERDPQGQSGFADPTDVAWLLVPSDDEDSEENEKVPDVRSVMGVRWWHRVQDTANSDVRRDTMSENTSGKKRRKALRKRVRKRVWRVVRSSWKYLRRAMEQYSRSTGLPAMFLWGVNLSSMSR